MRKHIIAAGEPVWSDRVNRKLTTDVETAAECRQVILARKISPRQAGTHLLQQLVREDAD